MNGLIVPQPISSRLCGQVAVANIADITLDEAIAAVGHSRATTTRDLAAAMRKLGYVCPDRLQRGERPPLAIGKLKPPRKASWWHWVVCFGPHTFDGVDGVDVLEALPNWRLTSYLPLRRVTP